jgi:hypothetical protein
LILLLSISNAYILNAQPITNLSDASPDVVNIIITSLEIIKSTSGSYSVTGAILNNSTENVDHIMVNVTLFDDKNDEQKVINRFVSGPFKIYPPNAIERFSFIIDSGNYDSYKAEAFADRVK